MTNRPRLRVLCLCASITMGCAGSSAEAVTVPATIMPAAALGDPAAELSPEGAAVTALPPPEPEDDPSALAPVPALASNPKVALPMFGAAVIHKVKDFDTWKSVFDANLDARRRAGFVAQGVMRGVDND
ncbi:MAG TPA: hypothetical protein VHZ95_01395, partial [Polyangiales bacterium]|nr:hypothetical protein [Polyangiales bacterium]